MVSTRPGTRNFPAASIGVASRGMTTVERAPAAAILPADTITTASRTGAPPWPSISVPPVIASVTAGDGCERRPVVASRQATVVAEPDHAMPHASRRSERVSHETEVYGMVTVTVTDGGPTPPAFAPRTRTANTTPEGTPLCENVVAGLPVSIATIG